MTVGHSLVKAIDTIVEKGKPVAATMLEAGEADIAYKAGHFEVVGTDRRVTLFEVAAAPPNEKARRDRRRPRHQDHHRDAADLPQRRATSPKSRSIPRPAT